MPQTPMTPFHRELYEFLKNQGATNVQLLKRGKHHQFRFSYGSNQLEFFCSSTPSAYDGVKNQYAYMKRLLSRFDRPVMDERQRRDLTEITPAQPKHPPPVDVTDIGISWFDAIA